MDNEKQQEPNTTPTEEPNVLAKAAETIAGDNKLLTTILKFVLSPLGLIVGVVGLGILIYQNVKLKARIDAMKKKNERLLIDNKELFAELEDLKARKRPKPKSVIEYAEDVEEEDHAPQLSYVPQRSISRLKINTNKRSTLYLD